MSATSKHWTADMAQKKQAARSEVTIQDKPVALCRCWASKKFPFCDGSHQKLDTEQGPVIVRYEEKS